MKQDAKYIVIFATRFEARDFRPPTGVKVVYSGIGKKRAKKCIEKVLCEHRPECVINSGFAGGLNPDLSSGAIVYRTSENDSFLSHSGAIQSKFYCSDTVITSVEEKRALFIKTGADVVDMESEIIFEACRHRGIPCRVIRVISDDASDAMPVNFNKPFEIALAIPKIIFVPGYFAKFNEFSKKMYDSAKALGDFLNAYFEHHLKNQK